jgi:two-component system response regulator CpxR
VPAPLSILLVEDNPSLREIIVLTLETAGHRVTAQADGRAGIAALQLAMVDLVITDVVMPRMDGVEFLQYVRQTWPAVPVVAMSGGGERLPVEYCLQAARSLGAAATLEKPFTASELLAAVETALVPKGRPASAASA